MRSLSATKHSASSYLQGLVNLKDAEIVVKQDFSCHAESYLQPSTHDLKQLLWQEMTTSKALNNWLRFP